MIQRSLDFLHDVWRDVGLTLIYPACVVMFLVLAGRV